MAVYNVEKISSWLDKFSNAKTAYNKDYSKYKGTYIYTTTESTVNRIKQDLSKNYDRIQKIYKNIYNQWNNYLNDLKATDNYLAGAGSSGAIKASSVSSRLSKLPKLKEYHAGAYEKLSAVNAKLGTIKTVGWTDGKTIDENLSNVMAKTGATISVAAVSVVEGVGIFAEGLVDCAVSAVANSVTSRINIAGVLTNNRDAANELNESIWKDVRAFVAKEHVKSVFDSFYENTDTGKSMKENAFGFDMVRSIGNEVGEVVGAVTVSTLTSGVVNPAVLYGASKAGNHIEENWQDENTSTQAGLVKGVFQGVGDGVFFAIGMKGDTVMKKAATEAVKKGGEQALKKTAILSVKTLFESGCSVAQDGSNILINALFSNDTVKTQSGEIIRLNTFSDKLNYYYQEAGGAQGLVNSMATASILSFTSDFVDVSKIGKNVNASDAIKNVDINTSSVKKNMSEINPKNLDISSGSKKINMNVDIDSLKREYDELIKWKSSSKFERDQLDYQVFRNSHSGNPYKNNMERISELEKLFKNNSSNTKNIHTDINTQSIKQTQLKNSNDRFNKALRFDNASDIAIHFDDSKQYLYKKLRDLCSTKDIKCIEKINEINARYSGYEKKNIFACPSADLNEKEIYEFLVKNGRLNEKEIDIYKNLQNSNAYSEVEKAEIFIFTKWSGPQLSAYNRNASTNFNGTIIDGTNNKALLKYVNETVSAYNEVHGTNMSSFKSMDEFNSAMDNIVNKQTLKKDIIVYRTVNDLFFDGSKLDLDSLKPGDVFNDSAHTSASAKKVKFQADSKRKVQLEICARKGTPAAYLESFTGVSGYCQQEILFGRNSSFKILGYPKIDKNGVYHIKVELIPTNKYIPKTTAGSTYSKLFSKNSGGKKVSQIISQMQENGMMNWYNREVEDMVNRGLYDGTKSIAEHDITHVKNVLLYTMNIGNDMKLAPKEMEMLVDCAKYHDVGVVNAKTHTNHSILSAEKMGNDLSSKYDSSTLRKMEAIVEFHELDDIKKLNNGKYILDDSALKEVCSKYGIVSKSDIDQVKTLGSILKDADALDRTRFPGNIDINRIRNKPVALEYLNASYDIRESISSADLYERLENGNYSDEIKNEVRTLINKEKYPDTVIDFGLKYYKKYKCSSITEYVEKIMKNAK